MSQAGTRSGPAQFSDVDAAADPAALIGFLQAARSLRGMAAARRRLAGQLRLDQAHTALDVGCGTGTDLMEMVRRMPPGARVSGADASEAMIAEARKRTASLSPPADLRVAAATSLPYPDAAFDACRAATVLQHLPSPGQAVTEMARVTQPGSRVAALEFDLGTTFLDHPDQDTTQIILDTFTDAAAQGRIGRQVPYLFRQAGLTAISLTALVILSNERFWQLLYRDHVTRLQDHGILTATEASQWWAQLHARAEADSLVGGATIFITVATKPASQPAADRRLSADAAVSGHVVPRPGRPHPQASPPDSKPR